MHTGESVKIEYLVKFNRMQQSAFDLAESMNGVTLIYLWNVRISLKTGIYRKIFRIDWNFSKSQSCYYLIGGALTEKGRISGASRSEQMFEHISIISNNFCTFFFSIR